MRRAFADTLLELGSADKQLMFLTGDLGFQVFDAFQQRFPERYVNVGVAEAQLVCAAAGMAMAGKRPLCYSIASFLTARAFEQIRISVCYPCLPVVMVGAGGGYTYAQSGVTHHSPDDLALMSTLPNMTVVAPADPDEVTQLLPQICRLNGPAYLRVGRYGEEKIVADEPAVLGRARKLADGEDLVILSTGDVTPGVLQAVRNLHQEDIHPLLYQIHTVKPLDTDVLDRLSSRFKTILVVEESSPIGGLYAAVCQWQASRGSRLRIERLGPPDAFALGNPRRETLRHRLGYDAHAVVERCRSLWNVAVIPWAA